MSKNDITGDALKSRVNNKSYDENFDKIFGVVCPCCIGSKTIYEDIRDDGNPPGLITCPFCNGTGKVCVI
jgi:hypothetical protein